MRRVLSCFVLNGDCVFFCRITRQKVLEFSEEVDQQRRSVKPTSRADKSINPPLCFCSTTVAAAHLSHMHAERSTPTKMGGFSNFTLCKLSFTANKKKQQILKRSSTVGDIIATRLSGQSASLVSFKIIACVLKETVSQNPSPSSLCSTLPRFRYVCFFFFCCCCLVQRRWFRVVH